MNKDGSRSIVIPPSDPLHRSALKGLAAQSQRVDSAITKQLTGAAAQSRAAREKRSSDHFRKWVEFGTKPDSRKKNWHEDSQQ